MIYLDNSATTYPKPKSVYDAVEEANRNYAFNAGRGSYKKSKESLEIIDIARKEIASFIKCDYNRVIFNSSATEAINTIINGIEIKENDIVYVTPFEHNAVIRTLYSKKANIIIIPFDKESWKLERKKLENMFAIGKPKAVFVSQISNVTGYEPEYKTIFELSKKYKAINVLDAAQGFGIINIITNNVDYVVFDGHKSLYSIFGVGGFIKLGNDDLKPYIYGGTGSDSLNPNMPNDCPNKYEAGSHNIVAIYALIEGARWIKKEKIEKKERELTKYLIQNISEINKVKLFVPNDKNVCGIVSISIDGYDSNDFADILDEEYDICVRSGYHCAPYVHDFVGSKEYNGTIRISVGAFNTKEEIDILISAIKEILL